MQALRRSVATTRTPRLTATRRTLSSAHERRHSERRVLPFSPYQLFDVVADVDKYSEFVPWCNASKVTAVVDEKHLVADLSVGFRFLSEKYSSVITLERAKYVKVDVPRSRLFEYLVNDWYFEQGTTRQSTVLNFNLRFAFRNPLYQRVTDLFFEEVVKQMVSAFESRCHMLHAPRHRPTHRHGRLSDAVEPRNRSPGTMHRW